MFDESCEPAGEERKLKRIPLPHTDAGATAAGNSAKAGGLDDKQTRIYFRKCRTGSRPVTEQLIELDSTVNFRVEKYETGNRTRKTSVCNH